ncbi:MAG: EAL domain-containing protein [Faecalibacillus faecis]
MKLNKLKDFNLKPALLGIEVTESGYLENTYHYKKLLVIIERRRDYAILDDYGTGYSNAYRLSDLTPHYIKIDRVLTKKHFLQIMKEVF